jgi:hypothetical protein
MAIDFSNFAFPKSRPKALDKQDKDRQIETKDQAENTKARKRAKGQCEVQVRLVNAKTCEQCGQTFSHGKTEERIGHFQRRRFCGLKCSRDHARLQFAAIRSTAIKPCVVCGALSDRPPKTAQMRRVCSIPCLRVYQRNKRLERHAVLKCRICGNPSKNRRMAPGGFCSVECYQADRRTREKKTRRTRICETCGAAFVAVLNYNGRWRRFCSAKCLSVQTAKRLAMLIVQCEQCHAVFRRTAGAVKRTKHIFCSKPCHRAYFVGEQSPAWRGGSHPNRGAGWVKLAERIRERDGYTCQRCTKTQKDNGERLSVDHIIPWRLFLNKVEANDTDNLISLCRDCHGWKTHVAERKMLIGDRIQFEQYIKSIRMPPLFASPVAVL